MCVFLEITISITSTSNVSGMSDMFYKKWFYLVFLVGCYAFNNTVEGVSKDYGSK